MIYLQCIEDVAGLGSARSRLKYGPLGGQQLTNLYRAQLLPNPGPWGIAGSFRDTFEEKRQHTEKDMRPDPMSQPSLLSFVASRSDRGARDG